MAGDRREPAFARRCPTWMNFSLYDATPKDSPRLFIGLVAGALTAMAVMLVAVQSVPLKKAGVTTAQAPSTASAVTSAAQ